MKRTSHIFCSVIALILLTSPFAQSSGDIPTSPDSCITEETFDIEEHEDDPQSASDETDDSLSPTPSPDISIADDGDTTSIEQESSPEPTVSQILPKEIEASPEPSEIAEEIPITINSFAISPSELRFTLDEKGTLSDIQMLLPNTLPVMLSDGQSMDLDVSWVCTEDYQETTLDSYTFDVQWSGYALSDDVVPPQAILTLNAADALPTNTDRYSIIIPSQISINSETLTATLKLTASEMDMSQDKSILVNIASQNGFSLQSSENTIPYSVTSCKTGESLGNGDTAAQFSEEGSCELHLELLEAPEYYGTFTDVLTFSISLNE